MRQIRSFAAASVVALAATGLAACGPSAAKSASAAGSSSPSSSSSAETVAQALAATSTTLAGYRSVTIKLSASEGSLGTTTLAGRIGWSGPLAEDITVTSPSQEAAQQFGTDTMRMKLSNSVMFMNTGSKMAAQLQGKHWMKIDMSSAAGGDAEFKTMFDQSAGTSPATQLSLLLHAPGMKRLGEGEVNGVQAVHYGGIVDLKAITDKALAGDSALKQFVDASVSNGLGAMQIDAWIDSRNLPVEIHETGRTSQGPLDTTVDYSGFSTSPLIVTPPPASDTFDLASMLSGLGH
jgi:hypothetical protein